MGLVNKYLIPIVFSICMLVVSFVVGLELIIFNEAYFEWHYENREVTETTDMTVEDLMDVTVKMLDYLKDDRETLDMTSTIDGETSEVFGEREKAHMVDVKGLYLGARNMRRMGMLIMFGMLSYGFFVRKELLVLMLSKTKIIVPSLMFFVAILAGLFATDFNKYFTIFHELFFDNDLWLLNPKTDILINMVPESYFYSIVMIGVGGFVVILAVMMVLAHLWTKRLRAQQ